MHQSGSLQVRPGGLGARVSAPGLRRAHGRRAAPAAGRRRSAVFASSWWPSAKPTTASGGDDGAATSGAGVSLFPAGKRQARVQLPALMLAIEAADVLDASGAPLEAVDAAVAGGATAVVLQQGSEGSGELYEAAVRLKAALRGRAALLVADRTDIVDVAGADGALLSPDGLPTVVAKRMLQVGWVVHGRVGGREGMLACAGSAACWRTCRRAPSAPLLPSPLLAGRPGAGGPRGAQR